MHAVQFFKRILRQPAPFQDSPPRAEPVPLERRRALRFVPRPDFPLKAVLSFVGRDDSGAPMSHSRHGWNWKGRLVDVSEFGVRMQLGAGLRAIKGDDCDLRLNVGDFEIEVPCHITNVRAEKDATVFGLRQDITDAAMLAAYQQLVEAIAYGTTLKLHHKLLRPDDSGYLIDQYASAYPARLTAWRHPRGKSVGAFEFMLNDTLVRAAEGENAEYLAGADAMVASRATADQARGIHRLFQWTVPNLAACVPEDLRVFLRRYA